MGGISLKELHTRTSTVERDKLDVTTEADIALQRERDGDADLTVPADARVIESPRSLRVRLGMTQPEMAAALNIPLGTWRNWEQGRVSLEPAAAALLKVVSYHPAMALAALASGAQPSDKRQNAEHSAGSDDEMHMVYADRPVVFELKEKDLSASRKAVRRALLDKYAGKDSNRTDVQLDKLLSALEFINRALDSEESDKKIA